MIKPTPWPMSCVATSTCGVETRLGFAAGPPPFDASIGLTCRDVVDVPAHRTGGVPPALLEGRKP